MKRNHIPGNKLDEAVRVYRHCRDAAVFDDPNPGHRCRDGCTTRVSGIPNSSRSCARPAITLRHASPIPSEAGVRPFPHHRTRRWHLWRQHRQFARGQGLGDPVAFDNIGFNRELDDRALMVGDRWTDTAPMHDCQAAAGVTPSRTTVEHAHTVINWTNPSGAVEEYWWARPQDSVFRLADNVRYVRLAIWYHQRVSIVPDD